MKREKRGAEMRAWTVLGGVLYDHDVVFGHGIDFLSFQSLEGGEESMTFFIGEAADLFSRCFADLVC